MVTSETLVVTAYDQHDCSFTFCHTLWDGDKLVGDADYHVEFEYADYEPEDADGDIILIHENKDGSPMFMWVAPPGMVGMKRGAYDLSPDEFQGLHEAIAHKVLDLYTNGFKVA